jgi:hypothetical protein
MIILETKSGHVENTALRVTKSILELYTFAKLAINKEKPGVAHVCESSPLRSSHLILCHPHPVLCHLPVGQLNVAAAEGGNLAGANVAIWV